jgi:predicted Rossmann fold flavoprotein
MKKVDVIIIGAGAAGLMCAIEAGKRGRKVLVLDHANKPGKKILMSGGGRCNFTNLDVSFENFLSHNNQFCRSALSRYTSAHFIDLVEKHKIPYHEKTLGQLFCDNKAKDILNMLLAECEKASADIYLDTTVDKIVKRADNTFELTNANTNFICDSLVVACGGLSIPTMGASPFAYRIAEQFDIKVWPTRAGLVPFTLHSHDKEKLAPLSGIAVECIVECNGISFKEAMLFTHRGLSGPAMLQISSYWQPGDTLTIKLLPECSFFDELILIKKQTPKILLKTYFNERLSKRLVSARLDEALANTCLADLSHSTLQSVCDSFQQWQVKPNNTEGYRTAEVTLGGVDCNAVSSKTFEARKVAGLYFIGEALDVTGWLGGYNFQWAWASGHAAGNIV